MQLGLRVATFLVVLGLGAPLAADLARAQSANGGGGAGVGLRDVPGARQAAGLLSSTLDGGSRYLAPDGPIQPAITAIGGLPLRGAEVANRGISQLSSGLDSGARRISQAAGGDVGLPGLEAMESAMPASISQLGSGLRSAIRQKNNLIRGQAEAAIESANRQGNMIRNGFSGMAQSAMGDLGGMMGGAQDALLKGSSQIQSQFKRSLGDTMNRMQTIQGMGASMRNQAEGIGRTLSSGVSGQVQQLQQTGEQLRSQLQGGLKQNMGAMSGLMGSLQGSASNLGRSLQSGVQGAIEHASSTASQVSGRLQRSLSAPVKMLESLGSSLGSMVQKAGAGASSAAAGGGRY